MTAEFGEVPQELKALPNWVEWKLTEVEGKMTKVPFIAGTNRRASSTDSSTWRAFQDVQNISISKDGGIGFVFTKKDGIVGIDLDGCRNPETGELTEWADRIVDEVDSFSEITPSQTGLHILVRGTLPEGASHVYNLNPAVGYGDKVKIEIFDEARYFTVTGESIFNVKAPVEARDLSKAVQSFEELKQKYPAPSSKKVTTGTDSVASESVQIQHSGLVITNKKEILMNGTVVNERPFTLELGGNRLEYPSRSEADYALVSLLAMDSQDPAVIDAEFRKSVLMREKWERLGAGTIDKVLKTTKVAAPKTIVPKTIAPAQRRDHSHLLNDLPKKGEESSWMSWIEQNIPTADELSDKEPEWVIHDMIYHTGLHLFSGHKGSMKSMLTMMLAEKICKSEPFLLRENIKRPITVVYIDKENPETEIRRRAYALGLRGVKNFKIWGDWNRDNPPPTSYDDVELLQQVMGRPDTLFIFDSFSSFLNGRDENSTAQMMELMKKALNLARQCAGVIIIHHSAKNDSGAARGNTSISNNTDMAFIVTKSGGNQVKISPERFRFCAEYTMKFEMDFTSDFPKYSYKLLEEQVAAGSRKSPQDLAQDAEDKEVTERAFEAILKNYNLKTPLNKSQLVASLGITSSRVKRDVLIGGPSKPWQCEPGGKNSTVFIPQGAIWPLPKPAKVKKEKLDTTKEEKPAEG